MSAVFTLLALVIIVGVGIWIFRSIGKGGVWNPAQAKSLPESLKQTLLIILIGLGITAVICFLGYMGK